MEYKSQNIICQNCKGNFTIEPDDFSFYEKMKVPTPEKCPQCRNQIRMLFRNFKTLYKRPSTKSGKMIISMYSPDVPFPVYDISEWWADDWDATSYAMDLDLSIPFTKQMDELFNKVPRFAIMNTNSTNCEYSNMVLNSKNCYLVFGIVEDENCDYGHIIWNSTDCVDNLYVYKSELCYECVDCLGSNRLLYSQECEACVDSIGLYDCRGCTSCIGCVGLRQQSYNIFNKQVTKEEYIKFLQEHPINKKETIEYILSEMQEIKKQKPARAVFGSHNTNVSGDHVYNAHNVHQSFDIKGGENSKHCFTSKNTIEDYDISFSPNSEYSYQILTSTISSNLIGTQIVVDSSYINYSSDCYNSKYLFGCVGLRNKQYCILNKQYTKEEYEKLAPQIIENMRQNGDWGNFFPIWMCPFAYNESIVNEYMPLKKEEALAMGFKWKDNIPSTIGQENCIYKELSNNPDEYSDEKFLPLILKCESCAKNYRFISREIAFYKRMKLALPNECFNCRHKNRMNKRNPRNLWEINCAKCDAETLTSYKPSDQKIYKIYCEKCYQQEVY